MDRDWKGTGRLLDSIFLNKKKIKLTETTGQHFYLPVQQMRLVAATVFGRKQKPDEECCQECAQSASNHDLQCIEEPEVVVTAAVVVPIVAGLPFPWVQRRARTKSIWLILLEYKKR